MSFLRTFLAFLALATGSLLAALHIVNPRGEFAGTAFTPLFLNVRKLKQPMFEAYHGHGPIPWLILGSSRAMVLPSVQLPGDSVTRTFNFAVHAAQAEDVLAAYRFSRRRAPEIRHVILAMDPTVFLPGPVSDLYQNDWTLYSEGEGVVDNPWSHVVQAVRVNHSVLKISYVADAVRSVAVTLRKKHGTEAIAPDGQLIYVADDAAIREGRFDRTQKIRACIPTILDLYGKAAGIDTSRVRRIDELLREARRDSVQVMVVLTPYHPWLKAELARAPRSAAMVSAFESAVRSLAATYDVAIRDYTDPERFGGNADDWYDCVHYGKTNAALLMNSLTR